MLLINKIDDQTHSQIQPGSYQDATTEVLTNNGWKLFKNLTSTDLLASVCPKTQNLIFEKPTRIVEKNYNGDMIYGKHQFIDFAVTPEHRMLVRKWNETVRTLSNNYEFVKAREVGWYCGLMNSVAYKGINDSDKYNFKPIEHKLKKFRNGLTLPMKYWLRFLGIYIAEGTLCKSSEKNFYRIQIACYKDREKSFVRELLNILNIHFYERIDRITFENKQLYIELENLGYKYIKAPQKFIPKFVFELSNENISDLIYGFFMGDGCQSKNNRMFYTTSKRLASELKTLIFLSGKWSGDYVRGPREHVMLDGRIISGNYDENCIIEWSSSRISIDRKKDITIKNYNDKIYCAEVPTYHTLVTKRNGKILIAGDCAANTIKSTL